MGAAASVATNAITKAKETITKAKEMTDNGIELLNGATPSDAEGVVEAKEKDLRDLIEQLSVMLETFESKAEAARGAAENIIATEVSGGRTIMRTSEIKVSTNAGARSQLKDAISDFIKVAQGGTEAKAAAVEGAENLVSSGLEMLLGVSEGNAMEKQGFVVLYLNYAFVRIDYFVYSYCVSGSKWGAEDSVSGACYLADLAVLDTAKLHTSEIDYLIAQSLQAPDDDNTGNEMELLSEIKLEMAQSAVLTKLLRSSETDMAQIEEASKQIFDSQDSIHKLFSGLPDHKKDGDSDEEKTEKDLSIVFMKPQKVKT